MWVSNFLSAMRNFLLVFVALATSENKFVGAQTKLRIMQGFGLEMREQKTIARHIPESVANFCLHKLPFVTDTFKQCQLMYLNFLHSSLSTNLL